MQRLINPWEYRHLHAFGVTHTAGGFVATTAGVICLSYDVYGWAGFFLVAGVLNLAGGYWYSLAARLPEPEPARGDIRALESPDSPSRELHQVGGRRPLGCHHGSITYASGYRFANRSERSGKSRADDRCG